MADTILIMLGEGRGGFFFRAHKERGAPWVSEGKRITSAAGRESFNVMRGGVMGASVPGKSLCSRCCRTILLIRRKKQSYISYISARKEGKTAKICSSQKRNHLGTRSVASKGLMRATRRRRGNKTRQLSSKEKRKRALWFGGRGKEEGSDKRFRTSHLLLGKTTSYHQPSYEKGEPARQGRLLFFSLPKGKEESASTSTSSRRWEGMPTPARNLFSMFFETSAEILFRSRTIARKRGVTRSGTKIFCFSGVPEKEKDWPVPSSSFQLTKRGAGRISAISHQGEFNSNSLRNTRQSFITIVFEQVRKSCSSHQIRTTADA